MKFLGLPVLVVTIAGCTLQKAKDEPPATIERQPQKEQAQPATEKKNYSLAQVINLLQRGKERQAEAALNELLKDSPKHSIYLDLMSQIKLSPQEYFNHQTTTPYRVKRGDSLARIAKQQVGRELAFYALAKLNNIRNASLIAVGQELKIPVIGTKPVQQKQETPVVGVPSSTLQQILELHKSQNSSQLLALYHQWRKQLESIESKEPGLRDAKSWLFDEIHEQAVSLYRQQQLEKAISLWEKLIDIDADFEAGQVYLIRAKSLLERLEKIN